jgi:cytoskeletal protein RodZ
VTDEVHKLGEVLRAAREAKGVDLPQVERETKIRERYLSALERGDYRELPGAVYTKGFLRNYGAYLGLDPEYLIDLYRLETMSSAAERPAMPAPPRPIGVRRSRTFIVSPGAVAGAILTILVAALVVWLGYEFVNFARTPELRVTSPAGDVSAHTSDTITIRGVSVANATITVDGLRENPSVTADDEGSFEVTVTLVPGSNVIRVTANDPVTERDSEEVVRTVQVVAPAAASPTPAAVPLALAQPTAESTVSGGVPIAGSAAPDASIQVTATPMGQPTPTFSVTDGAGAPVAIRPAAPQPPQPTTLTADAAGAFAGTVALGPGTWDVSVTGPTGDPTVRRVTVQPGGGLAGTLRVEGGQSYIEIDQDGTPIAGVSGTIADSGETVELRASRELRILAGNAGATRLTINGIGIGAMGAADTVVEWRITRTDG